jgi:hypothetical protein
MPYDAKLQLKALGSQSASTTGTPIDLGTAIPNGAQLMQFDLYWNAITGATPTVDVKVEESPDQTNWRQVTQWRTLNQNDNTFTGPNINGRKMPRFGLVTQEYIRYNAAIAGTGAGITYSIFGFGIDAVGRDIPRMSL